ncbi:MAG: nucleotidyl transferase AbiEii/AbiGii toxin family protein [Acidobacteria bacterium]|nr:nucleotidyl transferase AbiEii/AbiGii toxin family protein [Acidobacteriota bacterium]
MPDAFLKLSAAGRREALAVAAAGSGRPIHLLDKDVWLVWLLDVLFQSPFGEHLVFKGGSSLSKGYQIISRFSEDVDLTYDIRVLAPELSGSGIDPLPATRSQEKRWTQEIRSCLPVWIDEQVMPQISAALADQGLTATLSSEGEKVFLEYAALAAGSGYVRPVAMLEFGARSTGEPWESRVIACDAAPSVAGVVFPSATARVMRPERTFWETAIAVHIFCQQGEFRGGERFSRHWHDLTRLDAAGFADAAIADRTLADAVAKHKCMFFSEKNVSGAMIDYGSAVSGGLQLVPGEEALTSLSLDYARMLDGGLLPADAESFETLREQCRDLEARANRVK